MERILVTGGTGFIGSHTVVELLAAGHEVTIVDNLSNSRMSVIERIARIARRTPAFFEADIRDHEAMASLLSCHRFAAVIHFAGLKAVGESVADPLRYYDNNVAGSLALVRAMAEAGIRHLVFSSSATVYGHPESLPIREDAALRATNPYGQTKLVVERMLQDLAAADPAWHIALLRYFNPVGAHPSGWIGEDPRGIPNNLVPCITRVASGKDDHLAVFGDDYPTPDGTGIRDYIHVVDLARGHLRALAALPGMPGATAINLGTGRGFSVLEMTRAFEAASRRPIPIRARARRPGDVATCYADPALATEKLGWRAERGLDDICRDAWRWQQWAETHL